MSFSEEARDYVNGAARQGRAAADRGRDVITQVAQALGGRVPERLRPPAVRPTPPALVSQAFFTGVGAADLALTTVGKRLERMSADALTGYAQAQSSTRARMLKAQDEAVHRLADVRDKVGTGFESTRGLRTTDPVALRRQAEQYVSSARDVLDSLAARGQERAEELRASRAASVLFGEASPAPAAGTDAPDDASTAQAAAEPAVNPEPAAPAAPAKAPRARKTPKASSTGDDPA